MGFFSLYKPFSTNTITLDESSIICITDHSDKRDREEN